MTTNRGETAPDTSTPEAPGGRLASPWVVGMVVSAGALGTGSVAPALPAIAADLGLGVAATAAVVSAYTVPFAAATIVAGQLIDRHGPQKVMRGGVIVAIIGIALGATAPVAALLLGGRALQGIGAAAAALSGYDLVRRRPGGLASAAAALTVGSAIGPLLGGVSSQLVGWGLAVALPLPLLLLGLALPSVRRGQEARTTDAVGTAAVAIGASVGAGALQLVSLSPLLLLALPAAVALLAWAIRRSVHGDGIVPAAPLVTDPGLRRMAMLAGSIAGTYFATLVIIPIVLGEEGWGPIGIGLLFLPPALTGSLASRFSATIAARLGRATDPTAVTLTLLAILTVVLAPPLIGALSIMLLAGAFGMIQPRLLERMADIEASGPATAIGTANLVFLLGGGIGSATVGGLGLSAGGLAMAGLVTTVAVVVIRSAFRRPAKGRAEGQPAR